MPWKEEPKAKENRRDNNLLQERSVQDAASYQPVMGSGRYIFYGTAWGITLQTIYYTTTDYSSVTP